MFTDVTLVCKDGKPPAAHNGILTSTSPFFVNILKRTSILIHYSELPFTFALQIICCMGRFSGNGIALLTLCWTKLALPVHDLAHHDNDQVEAHFPLHNVWKDHLRPRTCVSILPVRPGPLDKMHPSWISDHLGQEGHTDKVILRL